MVIARLERDVNGRALRVDASQRQHLGMRAAGALVPAFADDRLAARHHAAHARVRRRRVQAALGE